MVKVFVDVADDDPVSTATTRLPAVVVELLSCLHKGASLDIKLSQRDSRMVLQQCLRVVGRVIVKDEVPVNDCVVVLEKEWQHVRLIPAERVEVDPRLFENSRSEFIDEC